jgi:hypothetical protein
MNRHQALREDARQSTLSKAAATLARQGPEGARRIAIRVLDDKLRRLPPADRGPLACVAGCDLCCHLRVMVTPVEVFGLLDYLQSALDPASHAAFRERVGHAAARLSALAPEAVLATNLACPLLVEGRCIGYPARPFNCRSYHSLDRAACQRAFDHPDDPSLGHPQLAAMARVHEGVQSGLLTALGCGGFDAAQRELVGALQEALDDPDCRRRFEAGEPAFLRPSAVPSTPG